MLKLTQSLWETACSAPFKFKFINKQWLSCKSMLKKKSNKR